MSGPFVIACPQPAMFEGIETAIPASDLLVAELQEALSDMWELVSHALSPEQFVELAVAKRNIACRHYRAPVKELGQPSAYVVHWAIIGGLILNLCELVLNYRGTSQKESGRFDLPIAVGILLASGQLQAEGVAQYEFAGELALTGQLRPIRGALATQTAGRQFILPRDNADEAALVRDAHILPADSLLAVCAHLNGRERLAGWSGQAQSVTRHYPDLRDIKGQAQAKRALEVAAAGQHSLLIL